MGKFGNFDLVFPGAVIKCDSAEKRSSIIDFLENRKQGIDIDVPFSYTDEAINKALYNTTYVHEGKHLHDHLVCPMLFHNYALKLSSLYSAVLSAHFWNLGIKPYKYLPLPFTKWTNLSKEKKLELIEHKGIDPQDVPLFSLYEAAQISRGEKDCSEAFTKSLLYGVFHYSEYWSNTIHNSSDGYNTKFTVESFAESLAFIQQLTEISLKYGDNGDYIDNIIIDNSFKLFQELGRKTREEHILLTEMDYTGNSLYMAAFTMVWRYVKQSNLNIKYTFPIAAYILFWALSPNILFDGKEAVFPRLRIEKLFNLENLGVYLNLDRQDILLGLLNDPINTFYMWDRLIGKKYVGTNIKLKSLSTILNLDIPSTPLDFAKTYNHIIRNLYEMIEHLQTMGYTDVANYIYNIADAMQGMTSIFCNSPSAYLYPENYLKNINYFVNVPFRIEFDDIEPIKSDECSIKRDGISIIDDCVYGDTLRGQDGLKNIKLDWRNYINSEKYVFFSEAIYGTPDINMPGRLIKEFLPGIRPWFFMPL